MKDKFRYVDAKEQQIFKQGVGQLGWLSGLSKPEMSFMFCALSTVQKNPQVADFSKYHKAVRELRSTQSYIKINKLELSELQLAVFSDASFGNLPGGASQLGYIIFCYDNSGNAIPLTWASKKAKRVARSTLTAETLAAVEAVDAACLLKNSLEEVLRKEIPPIQLFVDNRSLHDAAMTSNVIADKRLMIDMSSLREMVDRRELQIKWVNTEQQLANVLTKAGASRDNLVNVLKTGRLNF